MKLQYMIDNIIESAMGGVPKYRPVGVWIQGPGAGLDVEMFYVESADPKIAERKEVADWVLNRLVENGTVNLPDEFLNYHRTGRSDYDGTFSEIIESENFGSIQKCGTVLLSRL